MKKKLPKLTIIITLLSVILFTAIIAGLAYLSFDYLKTKEQVQQIMQKVGLFEENLDETLFQEHLKLSGNLALTETIKQLELQIEELNKQLDSEKYSLVPKIYDSYSAYIAKLQRNAQSNLNSDDEIAAAEGWSQMLLDQEFEDLLSQIDENTKSLENKYQEYLASLPPPPAAVTSSGDYSYHTISNERGTFGVYLIKVNLNSVRVVTAAASSDDCDNNCPVKSLEQHVKDNGGFAGMNGTYFCPPDYSECSNKVNTFDFGLYKSSSNKWLNKNALGWSDTGLFTFKGSDPDFYRRSTEYGGGSVTAGISNYPSLLKDREVIVDTGKLTSFQRDVKGTRGAIGVGDENLYLAQITNATVLDAAYVMRDLGAKHALNLDGGGSTAMYINGGYVLGPGRGLPNAVVLVR